MKFTIFTKFMKITKICSVEKTPAGPTKITILRKLGKEKRNIFRIFCRFWLHQRLCAIRKTRHFKNDCFKNLVQVAKK